MFSNSGDALVVFEDRPPRPALPGEPEPAATPSPIRIARDYDGFRAALADRRAELCLSMLELDHIAQLPSGYSSKLLSRTRSKGIGPESMGKLLAALNVVIRLEPAVDCDEDSPSGIESSAPYLRVLRERARRGGLKRFAQLSASAVKLTAFARKGGRASGVARRRAKKKAPGWRRRELKA